MCSLGQNYYKAGKNSNANHSTDLLFMEVPATRNKYIAPPFQVKGSLENKGENRLHPSELS